MVNKLISTKTEKIIVYELSLSRVKAYKNNMSDAAGNRRLRYAEPHRKYIYHALRHTSSSPATRILLREKKSA